jgi:uncharacterized protein
MPHRQPASSAPAKDLPPLDEVLRLLGEQLPELGAKYQVRSLGVFGSYAHGQARRSSDLDLLVEFDRAPTLLQFVRLQRELTEALGVKVDLVMRSALKPALGARILEEVRPV